MIKPILLIELPSIKDRDQMKEVEDVLNNSSANQDYHIIIVYSDKSEFPRLEIITASDVSIHKV